MKQLTQQLKSGDIKVQEVPEPLINPGFLKIKNNFSIISAGTEGSTLKTARKSLIGKAKEKPQQLQQVIDTFKQKGPVQTYRAVMKKLDAYSPLGYSSSGEVLEIGENVTGFSAGDKVACAGAGYASHAEIVTVPANLCVKLHPDADMELAALNTLGAIALQGIRNADLKLGESCAVIGLGLIGQLTCLMLEASGVSVVGLDIDPYAVETAGKYCTQLAIPANSSGVVEKILAFSQGHGVDAVIITAGTSQTHLIDVAGSITRHRGKVIVVGVIPMVYTRDPHFYKKEIEVRISCSYGPGRYDLNYEEKGLDYPYGYVRWTENRNMSAFQELLYHKKIDAGYLITHRYKLENSPAAYDMILNRTEPFLGISIQYDSVPDRKTVFQIHPQQPKKKINVAFIGAGSYAQSNLLPNIPGRSYITRKAVLSGTGAVSKRAAERFRFEKCVSDAKEIIENPEIDTVFVVTRHNTHADYVKKLLRAGKHVFVEKPLALTMNELQDIIREYQAALSGDPLHSPSLMIGYNRRFSPLVDALFKHFHRGKMSMLYRINAGAIPANNWLQDKKIGGGRIIGEVCHFVDLLTFFNGSLPTEVHAFSIDDPLNLDDTITINLSFENGSIGTICYFSNGAKSLTKEYIEVYQNGITGIIDDFRILRIFSNGKEQQRKLLSQDKGQKTMLQRYFKHLKSGKGSLINFDEIIAVSVATFKIIESLAGHNACKISLSEH